MRVRLAVAAVFAASLTCATQARATLYDWTYGGDGHHSGSGTLTTTGATSPFTITAITGSFDSTNIFQLEDPGNCCGIPGNDNLLYSPPSTLLDGNGLLQLLRCRFEFGNGQSVYERFDGDRRWIPDITTTGVEGGGAFEFSLPKKSHNRRKKQPLPGAAVYASIENAALVTSNDPESVKESVQIS